MLTPKILIIGGSYFTGRALVELLVQEKAHEIFIFNRGNIPLNMEGVKECRGDRTLADSVSKGLPRADWDAVIDLCGYSDTDVMSALKGIQGRIRHYIYISTVSVYDPGPPVSYPLEETSSLLVKPFTGSEEVAGYILGKIRAEACLTSLCRERSIPFTILRPSIIYGRYNYAPRETWFFDRIEKGEPIIIPKSNLALFSFIFVEDLARIISLCMFNPAARDQVFNAVSPELVSYERFADILIRISGRPLKIMEKSVDEIISENIPLPFPMDHHEIYSGDKLARILGFTFTPLAEGMKKTFEFYQYLSKARERQNGRF